MIGKIRGFKAPRLPKIPIEYSAAGRPLRAQSPTPRGALAVTSGTFPLRILRYP
jgi:hypothetical protein